MLIVLLWYLTLTENKESYFRAGC